MMSRTHLAMGMAVSLAVVQPTKLDECFTALIGGAVGGVLADIDTLDNDYKSDALVGQLLAAGIAVFLLAIDYFCHIGICDRVVSGNKVFAIIGAFAFIALWVWGFLSEHRSFTHSILAAFAFTVAIGLVCVPIAVGTFLGYASHLILDLLNRKDIPLLYPLKFRICFKLCYANKTANFVFACIGFVATGILLALFIIKMLIGS